MLFLKDIVKSKASSSDLIPKAPTVTDDREGEREAYVLMNKKQTTLIQM